METLDNESVRLHPEVAEYCKGDNLASAYGKHSLKAFFESKVVILASASAAIGGFLFGFDQGVISIILTLGRFLKVFPETDASITSGASFNKGLMTALLELGAALGAIQSGYAADRISRRYVLLLGTAWFLVGSTLQTAAFWFPMLVVGRVLGGIGIGTLACVAPLFIGEIAPPHLRGSMLVFESWMVVLGVVIAFYISYATKDLESEWAFRLPFLLQMIPAILLGGLVYFLPFSPRWLVLKGRDQEALQTLGRIRELPTNDPRVQAEWVTIRADYINTRTNQELRHPNVFTDGSDGGIKGELLLWMDCFKPGLFRRTIIGIGLQFFQQFIGINAIVYYAPSLYASLGYSSSTQLNYSGITNIMQLVGVTPTFFILDRVGRRPLLLAGSVICTICHLITAILTLKCHTDWPAHTAEAKVGVAMLMVFMFTFGASWAPIPWAMPPEVLSSSYRSKGTALAVVSNWTNNFIIGLITPIMVSKTNGYGAFFFFAAFSALSFVFVWFLVPETMGVALEDMDKKFGTTLNSDDEQRKKQILADLLQGGMSGAATPPYGSDEAKVEVTHVEGD